MYKTTDKKQFTFSDFNQPMGMQMNPENRWVQLAELIPWQKLEKKYAKNFTSHTGNVAKPLQMALGSLIIQTKFQFSDVELVAQIQENPYFQYFIGLAGYQENVPFHPSVLVDFRKRITPDMIAEANEYIINPTKASKDDHDSNTPTPPTQTPFKKHENELVRGNNKGTVMIDATCAPSNIKFPQDYQLLNVSRGHLEEMIDFICDETNQKKPRTYRRRARKEYLALAKSKKPTSKKIRKCISKQLSYVTRNLRCIENLMSQGFLLPEKEAELLSTIKKVYAQQEYMYKNKTHVVKDRIVSISQPYIRPIKRGKSKSPTEFGVKLDISIEDNGLSRIETMSFDAYNESTYLQTVVERYYQRNGYYPKRVLVDQIYRTQKNRAYCKEKGIRLSGPKLGRPNKNKVTDRKIEYQDNVDRIEVERAFSLAKRCYGMDLIRTKLEETTYTTIALSIFTMNLFKVSSCLFFEWLKKRQNLLLKIKIMRLILPSIA